MDGVMIDDDTVAREMEGGTRSEDHSRTRRRCRRMIKGWVNNGVLYFLDYEDICIVVLSVLVSML